MNRVEVIKQEDSLNNSRSVLRWNGFIRQDNPNTNLEQIAKKEEQYTISLVLDSEIFTILAELERLVVSQGLKFIRTTKQNDREIVAMFKSKGLLNPSQKRVLLHALKNMFLKHTEVTLDLKRKHRQKRKSRKLLSSLKPNE